MKIPRLFSKIAAIFKGKKPKPGARKASVKGRTTVESAVTPGNAKRAATKRARDAAKVSRKSR